jgi:hypothetical protein
MKKYLLFLCVLAMAAGKSSAQDSTSGPPPGPLVVTRMPDRAQWTIDFTYTDAPKPGTVSPQLAYYQQQAKIDPIVAKQLENPAFVAALDPARPVHIVVTKTGTTWHMEENMERGEEIEEWHTAQVTAVKKPGMNKFNVVLEDNTGRVDFPEFYWLAKGNYTGPATDGGQKTLVFKAQVDATKIHNPGGSGGEETVPGEAHIDWKTRYPVSFEFLDETRRYTYQSPPTEALVVPDEINAVWKAAQKHMQQLVPTPTYR